MAGLLDPTAWSGRIYSGTWIEGARGTYDVVEPATGGRLATLGRAAPATCGPRRRNDQTVNDEATVPFGGVRSSGNGGRLGGGAANLDAFTETQWVTVRGDLARYPF